MNRDLTKEEVKKTKASIAKLSSDIAELLEAMEYAHKKLEMLQVQWKFEDYENPISRKNTIANSNKKVTECDKLIKEKQNIIAEGQRQIKEGVSTVAG